MSKEYIAKTLKRLRESVGLTADQVGETIGKSGKTVNAWENGRGQPDAEILIKLCGIYKVDNLLAEFDTTNTIAKIKNFSAEEISIIKKYRALDTHGKDMVGTVLEKEHARCIAAPEVDDQSEPTISIKHSFYKVSAGHGYGLDEGDSWEEIEIPDTPEARKADFAVTIQGDSMQPIYFDGDIVLVKSASDVDKGQVGIFYLNGKGYIKKKGNGVLISLNKNYEDIIITDTDEFRCFGSVVGRI